MAGEIILEMKNIHKRFQGVYALNDVSFTLRRGEVHALVGENGAGKSTLMKILAGLYQPDQGEIVLNGEKVVFRSVKDAQKAGISMIFQEFNQVKYMTVMENVYLGREPMTRLKQVDYKKMYADTKEILDKLEVDIDPRKRVFDLTVAKIQLVEIVKAISFNSDIIIMDEPTSALSDTEIENLMRIVRNLRDEGKAIVFISHKLEEIYGVCDRVTVLRDGYFIGSDMVASIGINDLIKMMVDREITEMFPKYKAEIGEVVLEVKNLCRRGEFENVSFKLHKGEILGLAGLMGAGRTEIAESIVGMRKLDSGEIYLNGSKIAIKQPKDAVRRGIVLVPEDRKKNGLVLKLSIKNNILMSSVERCVKTGSIRKNLEKKYVSKYIELLEIKTSGYNQVCANLSGGNQQKVVISRVLNADPQIIILDEPTRGIDVKTKSDVHRLMSQLARQGKAIIMISSELPEILGMSDRIIVLHEGRVTGELKREEADQKTIMRYAVGHQ
ncbi:MAG: sugar ABC transporter ATP-binding protein [Acetivibrionales bacterium]|jgi:inositol transport system ATP-binding protein